MRIDYMNHLEVMVEKAGYDLGKLEKYSDAWWYLNDLMEKATQLTECTDECHCDNPYHYDNHGDSGLEMTS